MFQSAIQGPDDTVQYMDTSPTVTVYSGGSRSWRTNNPGMLGFGLFAYGHGAIGQACGLAAFKDYNSGKQALAAMLGEDRFMMLTVEQAYQQFDPSYHVPPPPPPKDADPLNSPPPPPRLCPYTGIDVDKFMSAIGGSDRRNMADAIEQMLDYTPGTITKENLEEGSLNQGNQVQAGTNVLINKRSAVHAGSSGTLLTPDVCNTPQGDSCPPVMYMNVARSADSDKTASSVKINGNEACHEDSTFSKSSADEGGRCGGIKSGKTRGKATFITSSGDVKIEGKAAVRQFDMMVSNDQNTLPMPLLQKGSAPPQLLDSKGADQQQGSQGPNGLRVQVDRSAMRWTKARLRARPAEEGNEE